MALKVIGGFKVYCTKCGNIISESARFCSKCGTKVRSQNNEQEEYVQTTQSEVFKIEKETVEFEAKQKAENISEDKSEDVSNFKDLIKGIINLDVGNDFLYFPNMKYRATIYLIVTIIAKLLYILGTIMGILYVIEQIKLGEGYKFPVYIIGFIVAVVPYAIPGGIFDCITDFMQYEKSDIKKGYEPKMFLGLNILSGIMAIVAMMPFLNPSDARQAEWLLTIGIGDFFDIIECFGLSIILVILSGGIAYLSEHIMLNKSEGVD